MFVCEQYRFHDSDANHYQGDCTSPHTGLSLYLPINQPRPPRGFLIKEEIVPENRTDQEQTQTEVTSEQLEARERLKNLGTHCVIHLTIDEFEATHQHIQLGTN